MIAKESNILNTILKNPLALIFLLLVITELVYKILIREFGIDFKISSGLKILLQVFFVFQIIRNDIKRLWPFFALLLIFLIGQWGMVDNSTLQKNLWFFDKYIFIFLVLVYVNTLENKKTYFKTLTKCFEWFMILNSIAIIVGFLLSIDLFETYNSRRFGYDGFILRSGAASYIYSIGLFYATHQLVVVKKNKWILLALTLIASALLGTKAIIIGWTFIILYVIGYYNWYKKRSIQLVLLLTAIALFFFWQPLLEFVFSLSSTFKKVYEEQGLYTALFSLRNLHLTEEMMPLIQEQWTWKNYLFGGGFNMHWRSQFGLLDLFYFFGIVGMGLYLWTFWKNFATFKRNFFINSVLACIFVLMALSAHFFYETILAFHLVFLKGYFEEVA